VRVSTTSRNRQATTDHAIKWPTNMRPGYQSWPVFVGHPIMHRQILAHLFLLAVRKKAHMNIYIRQKRSNNMNELILVKENGLLPKGNVVELGMVNDITVNNHTWGRAAG
jgi:hypothetical protein